MEVWRETLQKKKCTLRRVSPFIVHLNGSLKGRFQKKKKRVLKRGGNPFIIVHLHESLKGKVSFFFLKFLREKEE